MRRTLSEMFSVLPFGIGIHYHWLEQQPRPAFPQRFATKPCYGIKSTSQDLGDGKVIDAGRGHDA